MVMIVFTIYVFEQNIPWYWWWSTFSSCFICWSAGFSLWNNSSNGWCPLMRGWYKLGLSSNWGLFTNCGFASRCWLPNKWGLLSNWGFCAKASWSDCWADVVVGIPFKLGGKLGIWVVGIPAKLGGMVCNPGNWVGNPGCWPCIINNYYLYLCLSVV